jgi:hypothetical protein
VNNIRHICFPKHFQAWNNVLKYDDNTNPSIWLEDYHLTCQIGVADDDLFIIQFLLIYLTDAARAWQPRNTIDSWEDLKEIITDNF